MNSASFWKILAAGILFATTEALSFPTSNTGCTCISSCSYTQTQAQPYCFTPDNCGQNSGMWNFQFDWCDKPQAKTASSLSCTRYQNTSSGAILFCDDCSAVQTYLGSFYCYSGKLMNYTAPLAALPSTLSTASTTASTSTSTTASTSTSTPSLTSSSTSTSASASAQLPSTTSLPSSSSVGTTNTPTPTNKNNDTSELMLSGVVGVFVRDDSSLTTQCKVTNDCSYICQAKYQVTTNASVVQFKPVVTTLSGCACLNYNGTIKPDTKPLTIQEYTPGRLFSATENGTKLRIVTTSGNLTCSADYVCEGSCKIVNAASNDKSGGYLVTVEVLFSALLMLLSIIAM